jgi:hypothetical protein
LFSKWVIFGEYVFSLHEDAKEIIVRNCLVYTEALCIRQDISVPVRSVMDAMFWAWQVNRRCVLLSDIIFHLWCDLVCPFWILYYLQEFIRLTSFFAYNPAGVYCFAYLRSMHRSKRLILLWNYCGSSGVVLERLGLTKRSYS